MTEAEPLYRRAIEIGEKILGKDHPTLRSGTTISPCCFRTRASMPRPSRSIRRAIEIDEQKLGKDHPNVATSYNNLALLLRGPGQV